MARPAACRYWGPPRKRMRRPFWRSTAPGDICFAPITRAAMSRCIRSRRTAPLVPHTAATQNNVWEPPKNNPGPNVILQYRFDSQTGRMSPNTPHRVEQRDLIGPRHYIHHPSLDAVYFSNEQGCSVTAYRIDGANGTLSSMQTTSTLPAGHSERTTCSQIHLTPSARLLYVGNRAVNGSSIAAFAVDPETGHLTAAGHTPTEAVPSAFCLDPARHFLFAAGTASGRLALPHQPTERRADAAGSRGSRPSTGGGAGHPCRLMMRERSGWRGPDSNRRSRGRPALVVASALVCGASPCAANSTRADMTPSRNLLSRGTHVSNPASSSGESCANLNFADESSVQLAK